MTNDESNSNDGMTNAPNVATAHCFGHSSFEFRHSSDDVAPNLLAVAPRPTLISLAELLQAIANAPRLIIRRVGVPLAALLAVACAICLHLAILGIFILGTLFGFLQPKGHGNTLSPGDEGGSGVGYVFLGEGGPESSSSPTNFAADLHKTLPNTPEMPPAFIPPKLPVVPPLPPTSIAAQELAAQAVEPEIIGIASAAPSITGTPKPRTRITPPSPSVQTLVVAPPSDAASEMSAPGFAGGTGGIGSGGDPEGSPLALIHGIGSGNGKGRKIGDGINRGESGANNPYPAPLDIPQFRLPDEYRLNPPKQDAIFKVTVLTSGRPGAITILQSCGNKEIDTLIAANIRLGKFRPAYLAGKPFEESMEITQKFLNTP
ncbi:MAG: hypothetical protein FWD61_17330 [Phycisphaerales bacterium]|nr:hypothetical protein [Phycisphaerales bacterium]